VQEIYKRLVASHDVTVVCGKYPGAVDCAKEGVKYHFVGTAKNNYVFSTFSFAVRAALHAKRHACNYDIVVEDYAPYNPVLCFLWHKRAVIQLHQFEGVRHFRNYFILGLPFFLIEKFYPRRFGFALAELAGSKELFGLKHLVKILPNGYDPRLLQLVAEDGDYVLFIGRFHIAQKGLDILSEALSLVKCRLVIVGGGKDESAVTGLFGDAVKTGRAELVGYAWGTKKEELLRKCLFMVVPSRHEGQPLIMMDAAACAKPVIVSDIPALRYVVEAGFGLSFKTGAAKDLADKINLLMGNEAMRKTMGAAAREYARNFSWDKIAEDYENWLKDIVG